MRSLLETNTNGRMEDDFSKDRFLMGRDKTRLQYLQ